MEMSEKRGELKNIAPATLSPLYHKYIYCQKSENILLSAALNPSNRSLFISSPLFFTNM
jgi:hypothetical protein